MRKIVALSLTVILLLAALCSCSRPPELQEIKERIINLIEASYEINDIFFGQGLPTYPRIKALTEQPLSYSEEYDAYYLMFFDEEIGKMCMYFDTETNEYKFARVLKKEEVQESDGEALFITKTTDIYLFATEYEEKIPEYNYSDTEDHPNYDVVRTDAKFQTIDQIKEASALVYTENYLLGIYQAAFDGVANFTPGSSKTISARFIEQGGSLRQNNRIEPLIVKKRLYEYDTMEVIRPSNGKYVNISIDSFLEGSDNILNINISLVFENGQWYLNSPTY